MASLRGVVALTVIGAGPLVLLGGCGEQQDGAAAQQEQVTGTNYVVQPPVTTSTTTTVPGTLPGGAVDPNAQVYIVQPGDSLSRIAGLYDITLEVLVNFNAWPEGIAHAIFQGDEIQIPPGSKVPSATPADADTSTTDDAATETPSSGTFANGDECPATYKITAEDTTRIKVANRFDITFQEMDAANVNTPGYSNFVVGTPITIPCPA